MEGTRTGNETTVRRFFDEVMNGGDLAVIDQIFAPDAQLHAPLAGIQPKTEGLKKVVAGLREGFPDLQVAIDDLFSGGDKVVVRWHTTRQTHRGVYRGIPPTGRKVSMTAIQVFRMRDGRIADVWFELDALGGARDMGVVPPEVMSAGGRALFVLGSLFRMAYLEARHALTKKKKGRAG
jgi:steroid delta-isomerase-like uncharacterized protein